MVIYLYFSFRYSFLIAYETRAVLTVPLFQETDPWTFEFWLIVNSDNLCQAILIIKVSFTFIKTDLIFLILFWQWWPNDSKTNNVFCCHSSIYQSKLLSHLGKMKICCRKEKKTISRTEDGKKQNPEIISLLEVLQ